MRQAMRWAALLTALLCGVVPTSGQVSCTAA
jgi:hypothetical protein